MRIFIKVSVLERYNRQQGACGLSFRSVWPRGKMEQKAMWVWSRQTPRSLHYNLGILLARSLSHVGSWGLLDFDGACLSVTEALPGSCGHRAKYCVAPCQLGLKVLVWPTLAMKEACVCFVTLYHSETKAGGSIVGPCLKLCASVFEGQCQPPTDADKIFKEWIKKSHGKIPRYT